MLPFFTKVVLNVLVCVFAYRVARTEKACVKSIGNNQAKLALFSRYKDRFAFKA